MYVVFFSASGIFGKIKNVAKSTAGAMANLVSTTFPAIFACKFDQPTAKWAKIAITKRQALIKSGDSMSIFLTGGQKCSPGLKLSESGTCIHV